MLRAEIRREGGRILRTKHARREVLELALVAALAGGAALRVLAYAAAFPLFNNIDEFAHFDAVAKAGRGRDLARESTRYDADSIRVLVVHGSPEYLRAPDPDQPPVFLRPPEARDLAVAQHAPALDRRNHEVHSPPAYYAVAGLWHRLGRALGFEDARGAYWIRFLNAIVLALLVVGAHLYARACHPTRSELRLGVPMLVAGIPQDVFYGINADALSPLAYLASLLLGVAWVRRPLPSPGLAVATGLFASLAVLVKLTNVPIVALVLGFAWLRWRRDRSAGCLLAVVGALLPVGAWMLHNQLVLGDATGNATKVALLGWSYRAPARMLEHEIFSPPRAWVFLMQILTTYWRGEFVWHGTPLHTAAADAFYCLSSAALFLIGGIAGALAASRAERLATALHAASLLLGIACLATLSVLFEYPETGAPSRQHPFFAGGRLLMGTLVPFACLYVLGIAALVRPLARLRPGLDAAASLLAVALLVVGVTVAEARLHAPVFASAYNWFALP
jgi:hypothetical protein